MIACVFAMFFTANVCWGFSPHKRINTEAVYLLPEPVFQFYKEHKDYLYEHAVDPDKRRHSVVGEAEKHFIDLNQYGSSLSEVEKSIKLSWACAIEKFTEDTLREHGIGPWNALWSYHSLVKAFEENDKDRILQVSSELGHYIADLHVPLHTTSNYNGQETNQVGIHALWETRLPELFSAEYDFLMPEVAYLENPKKAIWEAVFESHALVNEVLNYEAIISNDTMLNKYTNDERNGRVQYTYSHAFSAKYHESLNGMVEKRMRESITLIASLWYSAWVDSGQPYLKNIE